MIADCGQHDIDRLPAPRPAALPQPASPALAAPLQLAAGQPVLAIGGFNGTDPAPTLAQFEKLVSEHKIHYFVGQNRASFGGGVR